MRPHKSKGLIRRRWDLIKRRAKAAEEAEAASRNNPEGWAITLIGGYSNEERAALWRAIIAKDRG